MTMSRLSTIVSSLRASLEGLSKTALSGTGLRPLVFVRTATKKVSGSSTNNRNSAGRRLGPKKGEGERVKVGDILYRQRGTKFYPGEHVAIGKDHTLVANEVGYVRFYRDPFHPNRKFIGLAIDKDARLPTPHLSPRSRRLGYVPVSDKRDKEEILNWKPRKETIALPQMLEELEQRKQKREKRKQEFISQVQKLSLNLTEQELDLAGDRLVSIYTCLTNGRTADEARDITDQGFKRENRLKKELMNGDSTHLDSMEFLYDTLVAKLDTVVMFDPEYQLCAYLNVNELKELKKETLDKIKLLSLSENRYTDDVKNEIKELLRKPCFSLKERVKFSKAFVRNQPPKTETKEFTVRDMKNLEKEGKGKIIQNWNYDRRRVERVFLPEGTPIQAIH
jgi:large subunit ribosomal protein L27